MQRFLAVVAINVLALGAWADDGPVTIKIKQPAVGDVALETKTEKSSNKIEFTVMGTEQKKDESATTSVVFTQEVLEKPAGAKKATKIKRVYKTAEVTKDGTKEDLELSGKTVLIEKNGDSYKITADGKELEGPAAALLNKEFSHEKQATEEDFLPKGPVKVGASWKVDLTNIAKDVTADTLDVNVDKSSGKAKLLKVYDKNGHKFGVLEINLELALNKIGAGDHAIELKAGAKLELTLEIDTCIDGSTFVATQKMSAKGDFTGTGNNIEFKFNLASNTEGSAKEVKK